jgi:hypothetical protein
MPELAHCGARSQIALHDAGTVDGRLKGMMRATHKTIFLPLMLVISLSPAIGATIALAPSASVVMLGESFDLDVVISGLGAGAPSSVSAFDLTLSFAPAILSVDGVSFGLSLGNPALFEALTGFTISPGSVNLAEVSLLSAADLDVLQPASFTLATLSFEALAVGMTTVAFVPGTVPGVSGLDVKDGLGAVLVPLTWTDATVQVVGVTVIPEPTTCSLIAFPLLAALGIAARRLKKS